MTNHFRTFSNHSLRSETENTNCRRQRGSRTARSARGSASPPQLLLAQRCTGIPELTHCPSRTDTAPVSAMTKWQRSAPCRLRTWPMPRTALRLRSSPYRAAHPAVQPCPAAPSHLHPDNRASLLTDRPPSPARHRVPEGKMELGRSPRSPAPPGT